MRKTKHKVGDLVACKIGEEENYSFALGSITKINKFKDSPYGNSFVIEWMDKPDRPSYCSSDTLTALKKLLEDIMAGKENETENIYIGSK